MKVLKLYTLLVILLTVASCTKWKENRSNTPAIDHTTAQSTVHDLFIQGYYNAKIAAALAQDIDDCRSFTRDNSSYPMTIMLEFGTENCVGRYNVERRGNLQLVLDKSIEENGAKINIQSQGFYVNDFKVEGSLEVTYDGVNSEGNRVYKLTATDILFWEDESTSFTWSPIRSYELVDGKADEDFVWDDVFSVTGTASGSDSDDANFNAEIKEPLTYALNCRWPSKGVEEFKIKDRDDREIKYGNGNSCSNKAEIKRKKKTTTLDMR